ncbi:hypothetical protein RJ640_023815 [Escallonia rubra]|uniref:Retrotransposon gag domain-containing protein n=1 Tax=Escallonia rubra TaxID=112253 RepID=A0AA88RJX6_9ASTE|nr:hypothetical protein RJ640_023815 [Escallonia rubra]
MDDVDEALKQVNTNEYPDASTSGDLLVKQFVRSLKGNAFDWYTDLEPESINCWEETEHEFQNRFYNTRRSVSMMELTNTKQIKEEPVVDYINRWRALSLDCKERLFETSTVEMCMQGMHWGLLYILQGNKPFTFEELVTRGHNMEIMIASHGGNDLPIGDPYEDIREMKTRWVPVYIAEIVPQNIRGGLGSVNQAKMGMTDFEASLQVLRDFDTDIPLEFMDVSSLQAALPNDQMLASFISGLTQAWFPQEPGSTYMSAGPHGNHSADSPKSNVIVSSGPKMMSLWKRAIESSKALLLDEICLGPDALLKKVEEFESGSQATVHSYSKGQILSSSTVKRSSALKCRNNAPQHELNLHELNLQEQLSSARA